MAEHENGRPGRRPTPVNLQGDSNSTRTSPRVIHDELIVSEDANGARVLLVLPVIPEDAPYRVREGIARRRIAATTGTCPCGATVGYLAATTGTGVSIAEVLHDRLCPAETDKLVRAVRRWLR